jgi:amino acid transporter
MDLSLKRSAERSVASGAAVISSPALRTMDVVALIVGTVIGAGIFRTPALVAAHSGSEVAMLLAWVVGGLVSLVGALCYAELATTYPHPGGDYHYLTRALGRRFAFLFAWARISVIQTGSIALLAFIFADYASGIAPLGPASSAVYAGLCVVALTALNAAGVRQGKGVQNLLTALEVSGLVLVVGAGLIVTPIAASAAAPAAASSTAFGLVMVFVLLTYGGWNEAAYISAEVQGRRDIARALVWSLLAITVLYVLVNWAYLRGLGLAGVAGSRAVAADLLERAVGPGGGRLVGALIAVCALTSANAAVFTARAPLRPRQPGVRLPQALARGPRTRQRHPRPGPWPGLVSSARRRAAGSRPWWYCAGVWLFFTLTGVSLLVLRRRSACRPVSRPVAP